MKKFSHAIPALHEAEGAVKSELQKSYAEYFKAKLAKFDAKSPAELTPEQKTEFFNEITKDWTRGEGATKAGQADVEEHGVKESTVNESKDIENVKVDSTYVIVDGELNFVKNKYEYEPNDSKQPLVIGIDNIIKAGYLKTGVKDELPVKESTVNEGNERLLKQSKLSSAEYQLAKKVKGFDDKQYAWNSDEDLYVKVDESLNEGAATPEELASFITKQEKHFAAFLKPKKLTATVDGKVVTIKPGSGSFTITVDYAKSTIDTTGKPAWPESTSYIEIMEYVKTTKFKLNESVVNEGRIKAPTALEDIVKGRTSRAEGIKISKDLADHYLTWLRTSAYGTKQGKDLPLDMVIKASFSWGIERGLDPKLKDELAKLKETINESLVTEADIKSEDDFKEYAMNLLKKAHPDDFDEAKANATIDGILKKCDGDFGAAVGMITSYLGESTVTEREETQIGTHKYQGKTYPLYTDDEHNHYIKVNGRIIEINESVDEGIGTIALGIMLAWAGLKLLGVVSKKVLGNIASNIEIAPDKLKQLTSELGMKVAQETGNGAALVLGSFLKIDLDKKIDSGEIKTVNELEKAMKAYLTANESAEYIVNDLNEGECPMCKCDPCECYTNENVSINEAADVTEYLDEVRKSLPQLEDLIKKKLGFAPKLAVAQKGNAKLEITSNDLTNELGKTLVKTLFAKIEIGFWGGNVTGDGKTIWFNPKVWYEHPSGGSNGCDFVWESLWWDLASKKWVEGRSIIK